MSNTLQSLLDQWQGMSPRERDAEVYERVMGARWLTSPYGNPFSKFLDLGNQHGFAEPERWVAVGHEPRAKDWDCYVPDYTSEDSPRSLISALEQKTIEKVGIYRWKVALWNAMGQPCDSFDEINWDALHQATADQRCCACWIAVMLEGGE